MKYIIGNVQWIHDKGSRMDSSYHLSEGRVTRKKLELSPYDVLCLNDISERIFYGGRSKRVYVSNSNYGLPFMGSSDMLKQQHDTFKLISKTRTKNIADSKLKKDWILISRSGTIGNTNYTTSEFEGKTASEHIIRVVPNDKMKSGFIYAFLSSKYGYALMTQGTFGAVIRHIEPEYLETLPIPNFPNSFQNKIQELISKASELRVEANKMIQSSRELLKEKAGLKPISIDDYEYFGTYPKDRKISFFTRNINELNSTSLNAFNYSKRVEGIEKRVRDIKHMELSQCIDTKGFFNSGSFRRLELESPKSVKLINQSDILNIKKQGKMLARAFVKTNKLAQYGEVLIAGVGTLGESETFCRTIFVNEELDGQLIAGEFIRMVTNTKIPSGYLYCWLSTDYGFRMIRKTQAGTKLCRPIPDLLKKIPVPILDEKAMVDIDRVIKEAHTKMFISLKKENEAIDLVEKEIESWQK
ncbi:methylation-associated defense system restriction endonuclease subunit S MAD5 [Chondrinema litorale]|uniref:methylation-associated defense system restriction endonuclease subunit S MAD5 n=1 Tax=Chondrinema litorale TaxID=2994555 RepID=UPI002542B3DF|nr:restriction endonuclease subunit S [Chondrinema litorale]UZS00096.1 restriction endonuclease subunit S [Chondrinema litorale]